VVVPSAGQFSPNGDGLSDMVGVGHALTEPGAIRLVVTPVGGGAALRTSLVQVTHAGAGSIAWDGRDDTGVYVPDGAYALTLTPLDRARNAGPSQTVTVTVFGAFVGLTAAPARFYPQDGDAVTPRTVTTFRLKSAADMIVRVVAASGATVRTIVGSYPAGPVTIAWDGRSDSGAYAPQGAYRILVVATAGGRSETHQVAVRAAAFELRPSTTSGRRRQRLNVTVISSESLKTIPRLVVRQPGLVSYSVRLRKVGPSTYRASWLLHAGGRSGSMTLTAIGTDRLGGRNATVQTMRIR
jgi:flagellar hook assembly protein FlgD